MTLTNLKIEYDSLYSLDKKGKIRVFSLHVTPNDIGEYVIISASGLLEGKTTTTTTRITQGKAGRNIEEQTKLVADSIYNDKKLEGYKSVNTLKERAIALGIDLEENSNDFKLLLKSYFKTLGITYNTTPSWLPLPMLASKWKDIKKKVVYPVAVQPKLNGVRCLAQYNTETSEVILSSRGGITYNIFHIKKQLEDYFAINQNLILDGELYIHGKPLQVISGEVRKEKDCSPDIEFHVYDVLDTKASQGQRLNDLRIHTLVLKTQFKATHIKPVGHYMADDESEVKLYHDDYVSQGYEGAIIRQLEGKYEVSFRSNNLIKVKEFEDEEFELIGCTIDPNKTVANSFVFILKNNIDDQIFSARPSGTAKQKETWYQNRDWIGKKATVRFQERSTGGLPIQGHVRDTDSDCLIIRDYEYKR